MKTINRYTLTTTPTKVSPTADAEDRTRGVVVAVTITTPGGVGLIWSQDPTNPTTYLNDANRTAQFTDLDPLPDSATTLKGSDQLWLSAETGTIDIQVIEGS